MLQKGSIQPVEVVVVGNKQLAIARECPATKDASTIARSLLHNVRNGSGDIVNIVENVSASQRHRVFTYCVDRDIKSEMEDTKCLGNMLGSAAAAFCQTM